MQKPRAKQKPDTQPRKTRWNGKPKRRSAERKNGRAARHHKSQKDIGSLWQRRIAATGVRATAEPENAIEGGVPESDECLNRDDMRAGVAKVEDEPTDLFRKLQASMQRSITPEAFRPGYSVPELDPVRKKYSKRVLVSAARLHHDS